MQQIIDRYIICKNCSEFDHIKSQCSVCGCNISVRKQNKPIQANTGNFIY